MNHPSTFVDSQALNILMIDDHLIFRQGFQQVLLQKFPAFLFTETSDAQEAMNAIGHSTFDLIILDIHLPDKSGIELLKDIKAQDESAPVIVVSFYSEEIYGLRVLKAQGASYLRKDCHPEELYQCIRTVYLGRKYITSALGERLAMALDHDSNGSDGLHETLTDREFEVLRLLVSGMTPTAIAAHLFLSVKTISTYRTRLLEKLNLKTTAQLIRYAITNQLIAN